MIHIKHDSAGQTGPGRTNNFENVMNGPNGAGAFEMWALHGPLCPAHEASHPCAFMGRPGLQPMIFGALLLWILELTKKNAKIKLTGIQKINSTFLISECGIQKLALINRTLRFSAHWRWFSCWSRVYLPTRKVRVLNRNFFSKTEIITRSKKNARPKQ